MRSDHLPLFTDLDISRFVQYVLKAMPRGSCWLIVPVPGTGEYEAIDAYSARNDGNYVITVSIDIYDYITEPPEVMCRILISSGRYTPKELIV